MSMMLQVKRWTLAFVLLLGVIGHAQAARSAKFEGKVTALSDVALPAQLTLDNGSAALTVNVTSQTKVQLKNKRGSILDLAAAVDAETSARVVYDTRTMNARQVKLTDHGRPVPIEELTARILSADVATGSIQLDGNDDEVVDLTVTADTRTKIELGAARLRLDQVALLEGLVARVKYDANTFAALEIKAQASKPRSVQGVVTDVDLDEQVLTLDVNGEARTFDVAADADIRLRGHRVSLEAVQAGDVAAVTFIRAGDIDVAVRVKVKEVKPRSANGELLATTDSTLTVAARQGAVILTLDANTVLRINGKPATIADLQAALEVGRSVRIAALYYERADGNLAIKVQANARGGGKGNGNGNGNGKGNGR